MPVRAAGLDALLVAKPCNVSYLTGFTGDSSFCLVTPTRTILVSDDRFRTQIAEECPDLETHIRGHDQNTYQAVGDVVTKLGLRDRRRRGVRRHAGGVREAARRAQIVDHSAGSTGLVEKLREVKDETEVAAIREAIRVAEQAFAALTADAAADRHREGPGRPAGRLRPPGRRGRHGVPDDHRRRRAVRPAARRPESAAGVESAFFLVDWGARTGLYNSDLTRVPVGPEPAADAGR